MHRIDRRQFLTESAFLAAAAALAPAGRSRADEAPKPAKEGSALEKLRVACVGVRGQGMSHVKGYTHKNNSKNCVITTICDVDTAVIGPAMKHVEKAQGKAPKFVQDVRKVIEDKDVDAVSIATPNHWHALIAIWAMQNGKDVYVEKPVSHNVSEGRRMVEAARKYNRICQTGTQSRSMSGMREAIAFLHAGKIGTVKTARALCYKLRPSIGKVDGPQKPPETMDYDLWCGPAPLKMPHRNTKNGTVHYDWHWIWDTGNGDLGNQGIHEMDKARWGLNKNDLPRTAMSIGGRFGYVDDGETANTQVIHFDFGDCELVFEVRGLQSDSPYPGKESPKRTKKKNEPFVGNVWYGSEGFLVCPSYSSGIAYSNDGEVLKRFKGEGDHFANFVSAVRSRKKEDLHADILEGHLSSAMCHLGNLSHRLGTPQSFTDKPAAFGSKAADDAMADCIAHLKSHDIDVGSVKYSLGRKLTLAPGSETFAGDKEANVMLTREYRKGFEVPAKV
jgi:predicted dehydrogenase